jgi:hypothetical protein
MRDLACTFWQIVRGILIVEFVNDMKEVEGNERWESKDELIYNSKRNYKTVSR